MIKEKLKEVLKNEDLTWRKLAEINGSPDHSNLKKNVERWALKLNAVLNKIGYEIVLKKKN
jgi:hypothetical protein